MNLNPTPNRLGWICPKCNKIHSPDVLSCNCCAYYSNTVYSVPCTMGTPWVKVYDTYIGANTRVSITPTFEDKLASSNGWFNECNTERK